MKKENIYKLVIALQSATVIILGALLVKRQPGEVPVAPQKISPVSSRIKPKIAIVIDDIGYNLNNLAVIEQIRQPLTFSVLPVHTDPLPL